MTFELKRRPNFISLGFAAFVLIIQPIAATADSVSPSVFDQALVKRPDSQLFLALLETAGFRTKLSANSEQKFTVLAPSDIVLRTLPPPVLAGYFVPSGQESLIDFLETHIAIGHPDDWLVDGEAQSLSGKRLTVSKRWDDSSKVAGVPVNRDRTLSAGALMWLDFPALVDVSLLEDSTLAAANGSPLEAVAPTLASAPLEATSTDEAQPIQPDLSGLGVMEALSAVPQLSAFTQALRTTGMAAGLTRSGQQTIFAPIDGPVDDSGGNTGTNVLQLNQLARQQQINALARTISINTAPTGDSGRLPALYPGFTLTVLGLSSEVPTVNGVAIVGPAIRARNATIYPIEALITP